jgi:hypothetical protein
LGGSFRSSSPFTFATPIYRPFGAVAFLTRYPGLKPWAESFGPFGAENNLAQVLMMTVEELASRRMSALILLFTAGSLLLFPLLALLQILVVDRIRIRAG